MHTDLHHTADRLWKSEEHRARATGFGTTKQGQALVRQYRPQLADSIGADRALGRDKVIWRALKGIDNDALALRLLTAGISVCYSEALGVDDDSEKNLRDTALWIGLNLVQDRDIKARLKVGVWGVEMLTALPAFALDGEIFHLTEPVHDFVDDVLARAIRASPFLSPLTEPPEPWTGVRSGGLPAGHWTKIPLIREHHRSIEEAAKKAIGTGKMQPVLDAINLLQRVPFTINLPILDYMDRAGHILPLDAVTAGLMTGSERFYVPLNIDFRGRIYGASHFNFQRENHVRALFLFADGEPIGEEGLLWLKAHVAARADGNSWSQETKPSNLDFDGRVAWTDANLATLRQVGEAILSGDKPATWVLDRSRPEGPKISEPYQFLAACVELVQALDQGPGFITRLPLTLDATCSGLQHLCGMTRAEEGRYVNLSATPVGLEPGGGVAVTEADPELIASFEADDFYRRVAHRAWEKVSEKFPDLMQGPFDREIVKQPAMSYFYGARAGGWAKDKRGKWHSFGMTKQVVVVLKDREKSSEGARELAEAIYEVIEDMVPLATAVRAFLEHLATQAVDKGKHLRWTTPLGLPVINRYHPPKIERISVSLNGRRRRVKLVTGDKEGIAKKKAVNAVTANFVHSVDAALLQMVALAAAKEGICMVSVHDCFGTIASRAGRLGNIIREQFVRLHKRHNLLNEVRESAKRDLRIEPPPAPETGNAEIEDVLASFFAFK